MTTNQCSSPPVIPSTNPTNPRGRTNLSLGPFSHTHPPHHDRLSFLANNPYGSFATEYACFYTSQWSCLGADPLSWFQIKTSSDQLVLFGKLPQPFARPGRPIRLIWAKSEKGLKGVAPDQIGLPPLQPPEPAVLLIPMLLNLPSM